MLEKLLLPAALLVAAGYANLSALQVFSWDNGHSLITGTRFAALCVVIAPFSPLLAVALLHFTSWRMRLWQALLCIVLFGVGGALVSLVVAALSGPSFLIASTQGLTLTLAALSSFLLLTRPRYRETNVAWVLALALLILPVAVSAWSIVSAGVLAVSARQVSDGQAYCLAKHGENEGIQSLADMRGLSFYTTRSGYKITSTWYFHGVLLVQQADGVMVYNWSPRRMRFDPVPNPDLMLEDPSRECEPKEDFLGTLRLV